MAQEEEVLGKAYDSRLMRRLLTYLRPYRKQVAVALVSIVFKAFCDVLGPYLVKVAIDRYLTAAKGTTSGLWSWLSPRPLTGVAQISTIYLCLLVLTFVFEFLQTYFMGVAAITGLQGDSWNINRHHVSATAKHFAVHGQPEGGTNTAPANYSERIIRENFLVPFQAAIQEAHAASVMASYNEIDGVPSHINPCSSKGICRVRSLNSTRRLI